MAMDRVKVWALDHRALVSWVAALVILIGFATWLGLVLWAQFAELPSPFEWLKGLLVSLGPIALAGFTLYEFVLGVLERRQEVPESWFSTADTVRRDIERSLISLKQPGEVSRCTLKVWKVGKPGEASQQALRKVWENTHRPAPASHVDWEIGKGVIGQCVEQKRTLAINVAKVWQPHWHASAAEWKDLAPEITFGLSHEEFLRLRGLSSEDGLFVLAIPVRRRGQVVGVAALDAPAYMEECILQATEAQTGLQLLGALVLQGDDLPGSVGALKHHGG